MVLILGFAGMVIGALVAPQEAYQGEIADRLRVIDSQDGRWIISKILDGLAVLLLTGGMVLLGVVNSNSELGGPLNTVASVSFGISGLVGLFWVYLLVVNPGPLYDRQAPAPLVVAFIGLLAIGLLAHGVHSLGVTGYPNWLGWLNATVGVLILIVILVVAAGAGPPEIAFPLAAVIYAAALTTGITLLAVS